MKDAGMETSSLPFGILVVHCLLVVAPEKEKFNLFQKNFVNYKLTWVLHNA